MRSHVGWRGERNILDKGVEIFHHQTRLKNLRESSKRTISPSRLRLLQMVSESDTGQFVNEDVEPQRRVDTGLCASEDVGPQSAVDCKISHRLERGTKLVRMLNPKGDGH